MILRVKALVLCKAVEWQNDAGTLESPVFAVRNEVGALQKAAQKNIWRKICLNKNLKIIFC